MGRSLHDLERVNRAIDRVPAHPEEGGDLSRTAAAAATSPFHFHRLFHGVMGEPLGRFARRVRLEQAACLLKDERTPVTEVAMRSGYASPAAFARAFRAHFGTSASGFRQNRKNGKAIRKHGQAGSARIDDRRPSQQEGNPMEIEVRNVPAMHIAYVRHVGEYDESEISRAHRALHEWAEPRKLLGPGTRVLGISYSDPSTAEPGKWRYDAAIPVPEDTRACGGIGVTTLDAGTVAVAYYRGPASGIAATYAAVFGEWLPESSWQLDGRPPIENHLNDPEADPDGAHELEIWVPVRSR